MFGRVYAGTTLFVGGPTELTEVWAARIKKSIKLADLFDRVSRPVPIKYRHPGSMVEGVPVPEVYLGRRTEHTAVSGTGIE